jgi:hypothetical protein
VILETNPLQPVSLWHTRGHERSEVDVILEEIEKMVQSLTSFDILHVKRSANNCAHLCAKQVSQAKPSLLWQGQPPTFPLRVIVIL